VERPPHWASWPVVDFLCAARNCCAVKQGVGSVVRRLDKAEHPRTPTSLSLRATATARRKVSAKSGNAPEPSWPAHNSPEAEQELGPVGHICHLNLAPPEVHSCCVPGANLQVPLSSMH
jgi:hypothetical protein